MELAVVFLTVLTGFAAGGLEVFFVTAVGKGFLEAMGVGLEDGLIVFFAGVVADATLGADVLEAASLVAVDDVPGGAFAGVVVDLVAVDESPAFSFLGTLLTGVTAASGVSEAVAAGFFTGVALVVKDLALVGVTVVGFFAVD